MRVELPVQFKQKIEVEEYLFDPFPLLCLVVCIKGIELKTILQHGIPALVLDQTEGLRLIQPADSEAAFWIPRRPADRKRFKLDRRDRSRRHITLAPPCWTGDERPTGAQSVPLEKVMPGECEFIHLKNVCWELDEPDLYPKLTMPSWRYQRPSRAKSMVWTPPPPPVETTNSEGFSQWQVVRAIEKHRWPEVTSSAVLEIVYEERRVSEVAEDRGLITKRLSQYAWLVRKALRDGPFAASDSEPSSFIHITGIDKSGMSDLTETSMGQGAQNEVETSGPNCNCPGFRP
jgi:hypothetical protein